MKKFFSLIALVGMIAACTPEQIQTAFKLAGAKGTINVEVLNLNGTPYDGQFQISGQEGLPGVTTNYSGNKATIEFQLADSQAVESIINLTLSASGPEIYVPAKSSVIVPKILAGGEAVLACTIKVGEQVGDWYLYEDMEYGDDVTEVGFLVNSHYQVYEHAITYYASWIEFEVPSWYVNNSDLILKGTCEIPILDGIVNNGVVTKDYAGFSNSIKEFVDEWAWYMEDIELYDETYTYNFEVSGWAMWNVAVVHNVYPVDFTLTAIKLDDDLNLTDEEIELGHANCDIYDTMFGKVEQPYPGMPGHAHYEEGHGHGHGAENAGGGISFNE